MDFNTLSTEVILKELSASAERHERVWSAGCAVLKARKVWPDERSFDAARDEINAAMIKGLSAEDQSVMTATSVAKARGTEENAGMKAKREMRATINNRLRQRVKTLRDTLFPSAELLTDVRSVATLASMLPSAGFSMLIAAPSKSGKTTLVRQLVKTLLSRNVMASVLVLSETAHITGDFSFLVCKVLSCVRASLSSLAYYMP